MARVLMAAYTNYRRDPRVRREAEALIEAGHSVVFLASRQPKEPICERIAGVEVIKLAGLNNRRTSVTVYLLDYLLFFLGIGLHLSVRPTRYDLVHINNMPDFLVFAALLPRMLGRPVIHDVHDLMPEIYLEKFRAGEGQWIIRALKLQERLSGAFASAVLTVEERLRDILAGRGIRREKIHVLMNLPDDRIFSRRAAPLDKPTGSPFVLVYHGTLARRLGLDIALEAVARIRNEIPQLELRIIGAGEERSNLVALRKRLDLEDIVTFSDGFVPVDQIPRLIGDADVGLVPLRVSGGTDIMLPTKLLEYVSIGIPCVVPRTGTITRYFDHTMVQFFEAEDVESLARAIGELYLDPARRRTLSREATARFSQSYSWSEHKKVYTSLVAELLSSSR